MLLSRSFAAGVVGCLTISSLAASIGPKVTNLKIREQDRLQDIVTWDNYTLLVRGERILFYSGEFHPFRLPVASLYLDVFQKIKALGYTGVSFYVDWALLEGTPGVYDDSGIFNLQPFFDAASEAGIYLVARPGPYINAEASGGGFPGWLQLVNGTLRALDAPYLDATSLYTAKVGEAIAKNQITEGGPIILLQPENEYIPPNNVLTQTDREYFAYVEKQFRDAGVVVPTIINDASGKGIFAPGSGLGAVDIYGFDQYPLGFDCANPYIWPAGDLQTDYREIHLDFSPTTPQAIPEFQGGSFDPWGGPGFNACAILLNEEFERVFYKNNFAAGLTIFNIYMTYGGTNWGNLGHPGGYTSYDYGAVIKEDRTVTREKYSEAKLEAVFVKTSPAYYTATPQNMSIAGQFVNTDEISVTQSVGEYGTNFYFIRHTNYSSLASTSYMLTVPTSRGNVTIPQLGGTLTLNGRDSKISVTDYKLGRINMLYSSSDIFTWQEFDGRTVVLLYGGAGETHELAFTGNLPPQPSCTGNPVVKDKDGYTIIHWSVTPERQMVDFGYLTIYLLWRNDAYNYWSIEMPAAAPLGNFTSLTKTSVIMKAGYLMRTASVSGDILYLTGDVNATTPLEIISGASFEGTKAIYFNGKPLSFERTNYGTFISTVEFSPPSISVPNLSKLDWKSIDSLPEIQPDYSDAAWPSCDKPYTNDTYRALTTPTSLYSSDYGFVTGTLLYRGHFIATGKETTFFIETEGGFAFGHSVWLNSTYIGSWTGIAADQTYNQTFTLPSLTAGKAYVFTIVIDTMGLSENYNIPDDAMKQPRGILDYQLAGRPQSAITWKMTGNLGGFNYADKARGPLNEGGLYAERQGFYLPNPPSYSWPSSSPMTGFNSSGVRFYTASFTLDLPHGYDIPLSFTFTNASTTPYRAQLYVNGYQFGKYVNNIGPQKAFPVPEGILNYHGTNWVALTLWAQDEGGAKVDGLAYARV